MGAEMLHVGAAGAGDTAAAAMAGALEEVAADRIDRGLVVLAAFAPGDTAQELAWMARNPVAANLMMLLFLLGGYLIARQVKQEVFPDIRPDVVSVSVVYPGATPEVVVRGICIKIEEVVADVDGIEDGSYFYFVHSYALPPSEFTLATADHDGAFSAIVGRGNFVAAQFHPERSGADGARVLKNFLELT